MARIKKRGLDYFPMNTDFMQSRTVRRIMKREGDGALAILLGVLSCIYSDEGYYAKADDLFYEDLADGLFSQDENDVRRIVQCAVEAGFFHAGLFAEHGILTSTDIQRQFLFSTKKRSARTIDPCFLLLDADELSGLSTAGKKEKTTKKCTESTQNVNLSPEKADFMHFGTQSIAQQSTAQHSKEEKSIPQHTTAYGAPETPAAHHAAHRETAVEEERGDDFQIGLKEGKTGSRVGEACPPNAAPGTAGGETGETAPPKRREMTVAYLQGLTPPGDGQKRNLPGLLENMRMFQVPLNEQYAIILKSNFGIIGHPVWQGFFTLRESHGKIRHPGRYLLSLCRNTTGAGGLAARR